MAGPPKGTLFVVATPIGNLGDLTTRAVETLRSCDRVLAEDTRRTRHLLTHCGITGKELERLDAHASGGDIARALRHLERGERIALVTDAGTPGVSDPGERFVAAAIGAGALVVPIPGASAVLAALVGSGLTDDGRFRFFGFLPRHGSDRSGCLTLVAETPEAVVLFESPARTAETLRDLAAATPERRACVARELTKRHEEFVRGTLSELASSEAQGQTRSEPDGQHVWLGEIAIVLGAHHPEDRTERIDDAALDAQIDEALAVGEHPRTIADRLSAWSGRPKRTVYGRVVTRKKGR